jgi:hypothetical protein
MRRLSLVLVVCGCASMSSPTHELANEYERDAKAFAYPAVAFLATGFTTALAGIAKEEPLALRATTYASLGAGIVSTVVAAIYGWLAEDVRERVSKRR